MEEHEYRDQKINRLLFIHDIERYPSNIIPLAPSEYEHLFGGLVNEDLRILTQCFFRDHHKTFDGDIDKILDKWGIEWMEVLLDFNQSIEEYELCAILRDIIIESKNILI